GRGSMEWEGMVHKLLRSFRTTQSEAMRKYYARFFSPQPCPTCRGERLKPEVRAVKVHGKSIVELSRLTIWDAREFLLSIPLTPAEEPLPPELLHHIHIPLR